MAFLDGSLGRAWAKGIASLSCPQDQIFLLPQQQQAWPYAVNGTASLCTVQLAHAIGWPSAEPSAPKLPEVESALRWLDRRVDEMRVGL